MSDHPMDIIVVRLGNGYFVSPRDQRKVGMRFGTYAEAMTWAHGIAMGRRVIYRSVVKAHASMKRTRGVALVETPCGVMGLPKSGRSVTTSRGRQLARRHGNMDSRSSASTHVVGTMTMRHIGFDHYWITDRHAARLAKGVGRKLPRPGYALIVILPSGHKAELKRTPYKHYTDAPKRGWVWAVMPLEKMPWHTNRISGRSWP